MKWFLVYIVFSSLFLVSCVEEKGEIFEAKEIIPEYIQKGYKKYSKFDTSTLSIGFNANNGSISCNINFDERPFEVQLTDLSELLNSAQREFDFDSLKNIRFYMFGLNSDLAKSISNHQEIQDFFNKKFNYNNHNIRGKNDYKFAKEVIFNSNELHRLVSLFPNKTIDKEYSYVEKCVLAKNKNLENNIRILACAHVQIGIQPKTIN